MIEERVLVIRPILHPVDRGVGNSRQCLVQLVHVVIGRISIYHNVVGGSILLKAGLLECTNCYRAIHKLVVIVRNSHRLIDLPRRSRAQDMQVSHLPRCGSIQQSDTHRLRSQAGRIHQHHGPVEKCVIRIQHTSKWPRDIDMNVIANHHTAWRRRDLPFAGLGLSHHRLGARGIVRLNVLNIGCKVADLINSIPHRHIQRANAVAVAQANADVSQMPARISQRNKVFGWLGLSAGRR